LPAGVEVAIDAAEVTVKGPKGVLKQVVHPDMAVVKDNGSLRVERPSDEHNHRALHGLTRSLLANMVTGVTAGFSKSIDFVGVGYRVHQSGAGITLNVMLSHAVEVQPPDGITLEVEGNNRLHVRGMDKQQVGQTAAEIRAIRPPNIYTGKGIRYRGELVRLKPGKSARRVA
jgi:large subunit ribosomal protein L6